MTVYLRFRNAYDTMRLDSISRTGYGVEALTGVTGLGLPPVSTQWVTGAGDGATYRGERKQPRDIDIPLHIFMPDRASLLAELERLSLMLMRGQFDFDLVEGGPDFVAQVGPGGSGGPNYWTTKVVRVGGGDFAYGAGTDGERELTTVITVRAGDPYFTSQQERAAGVANTGAGRGLLASGISLTKMRISAGAAIGDMLLDNEGDASADLLWRVNGPGTNVVLSDGSRVIDWQGSLDVGEVLYLDTKTATAQTAAGANRYEDLAPAPRFWKLPPGQTQATVSMQDTTSQSAITATWRPRKWWVV